MITPSRGTLECTHCVTSGRLRKYFLSRHEVSLKGRQPLCHRTFHLFVSRLPHLRVRLLVLRPLRDGLVVFALFTFFLVVLFLSVYPCPFLALLTQFGLTSSSPSVAILCSSSWPLAGFDVLFLELWSSSSLPVRAGCGALLFSFLSSLRSPGGLRRPKYASRPLCLLFSLSLSLSLSLSVPLCFVPPLLNLAVFLLFSLFPFFCSSSSPVEGWFFLLLGLQLCGHFCLQGLGRFLDFLGSLPVSVALNSASPGFRVFGDPTGGLLFLLLSCSVCFSLGCSSVFRARVLFWPFSRKQTLAPPGGACVCGVSDSP